MKRNSALAV